MGEDSIQNPCYGQQIGCQELPTNSLRAANLGAEGSKNKSLVNFVEKEAVLYLNVNTVGNLETPITLETANTHMAVTQSYDRRIQLHSIRRTVLLLHLLEVKRPHQQLVLKSFDYWSN